MCSGERLSTAALVRDGDLDGLLEVARDFHGHVCPYVALGLKASLVCMRALGSKRVGFEESVSESLLAIVECNNCFTDGVQVATGCTLGNNSLIYFDLGKTALTLVRREDWRGVRVYADDDKLKDVSFPPEAEDLFAKVVTRREGTPEEAARLGEMWEEVGHQVLALPDSIFKLTPVAVAPIEQAPIFESQRCHACGELAMQTRMVEMDGQPYCLSCAGQAYQALIGRGIVEMQPKRQER